MNMTKRKASEIERLHDAEGAKRSKANTGGRLIRKLHGLSSTNFQHHFIKDDHLRLHTSQSADYGDISLQFKSSSEMTKEELNTCFNLMESTSRPDYETSGFGWHPRGKRREMREDEMRYLLVRSDHPGSSQQRHPDGDDRVQGFISFMLTHDSSPSVPVLYVYEIHLIPRLRKVGLGAHLMHVVEHIAQATGMEKVMLTCFVCNEKAYSFYERRGYEKDVISPEDRRTRTKVVKADYAIMSRDVG